MILDCSVNSDKGLIMAETVNAAVENLHIEGDHKARNKYIVS